MTPEKKQDAVVVRLSNLHKRFDDSAAVPLFEALHQHLLLRPAAVRNAWGQLWIHHTDITDAAAPSLARLVSILDGLTELHVSDTAVTLDTLAQINAARAALHCRLPLYVNARHIAGPVPPFPALRLALARRDYPKFKFTSPNKPALPRSTVRPRDGPDSPGSPLRSEQPDSPKISPKLFKRQAEPSTQ